MNNKAREVKRLHRKAMEYVDEAYILQLEGEREQFLHFTRLALEKETAAADLMLDEDIEPTRSVLHRSAATLAWRCQEYDRAKRLAYRALAGNPPPDIAWELKDLLSTVRLEEAGIRLGKGQLQFSLQGSEVGYGKAALSELTSRMPSIGSMLQITAKSVYRRLSDISEVSADDYSEIPIFVDSFASGSFIVSLRLGSPIQNELLGFERFDNVIEPFLQHLNLVDRGEFYELQKELDDPDAYLDFVKAARKLAPDGNRVDSVKFQASVHDQLKIVSFNATQRDLADVPLPEPTAEQGALNGYQVTGSDLQKEGVLKVADGLVKTECVLVTDDNAQWDIEGPEDVLDEIVRMYFKRRVAISGKQMKKKKNRVNRIRLASTSDVSAIDDQDQQESTDVPALPLPDA
ncbi:MAG: hypothetical protein OXT68_01365 [Chloroflexota bacterium]|nr:hypothetical protein [Chloroflexota bacterium]